MKNLAAILCASVLVYNTSVYAQESVSDTLMKGITESRKQGNIKEDGSFTFTSEESNVAGTLLCPDAEIETKIKALETELQNPDFNIETSRRDLNSLLKCVSLSDLKVIDLKNDLNVQFSGNYHYPVFSDGSFIKIKTKDKNAQVDFGLTGTNQDFNLNVVSDQGQKLATVVVQYDASKIGPAFEIGFLAGLAQHLFPQAGIEKKFGKQISDLFLSMRGSAHLLKAELYQPSGMPVLLLNGDLNDNYDLNVFSSLNKKFVSFDSKDNDFRFNLRFPRSDMPILDTHAVFSPNFRTQYEQTIQEIFLKREENLLPQVGKMISGLQQDIIIYGLNGNPLLQFQATLNDDIRLSDGQNILPADILNHAELKVLQENACPIRTVHFTKSKPNFLTICRADGCRDEDINSIQQLMDCFGEVAIVFQRLGNEIQEEAKNFSDVKLFGFYEGYTMAMGRYKANEILNTAAMVAVLAMSKNGGEGGEANLSDLGGVKTLDKLSKIFSSDQDISSTKEGIVTIILDLNQAKDIMPHLRKISDRRVVSGCTDTVNFCVVNFGIISSVKEEAKPCKQNADCNGEDQGDFYCKITNYEQTGEKDPYYKNISGICSPRPPLPETKKVGKYDTYSFGKMNWWSANNVCKSHGMNLFRVEDFECYFNTSDQVVSGSEKTVYCCRRGEACFQDDWKNRETNGLFSQMIVETKRAYKDPFYPWLASPYNSGSDDTRSSYAVHCPKGYVGSIDRAKTNVHVLCH